MRPLLALACCLLLSGALGALGQLDPPSPSPPPSCSVTDVSVFVRSDSSSADDVGVDDQAVSYSPPFAADTLQYTYDMPTVSGGVAVLVRVQVSQANSTVQVGLLGADGGDFVLSEAQREDTTGEATPIVYVQRFLVPAQGQCIDVQATVSAPGCEARTYTATCNPMSGGANQSTGAGEQPQPVCPVGFVFGNGITAPEWEEGRAEYTCSGFSGETTTTITLIRPTEDGSGGDVGSTGGVGDGTNGNSTDGGDDSGGLPPSARRLLHLVFSARRHLLQVDSTPRVVLNGMAYLISNDTSEPFPLQAGSNVFEVFTGEGCPVLTFNCTSEETPTPVPPIPVDSSTAPDQGGQEQSTGGELPSGEGWWEETTPPAPECQLQNVSLGTGIDFFPAFQPNRTRYWCSCGNDVFLGQVNATAVNESALLLLDVNGQQQNLTSGLESGSYEMQFGANRVNISVSNPLVGCETLYSFMCDRFGNESDANQTLYAWFQTSWSPCSGVCVNNTGVVSGNITREVYCIDSNGLRANDTQCSEAGLKPDELRSCVRPCGLSRLDVVDNEGGDLNDEGGSAPGVQASLWVSATTALLAVLIMA